MPTNSQIAELLNTMKIRGHRRYAIIYEIQALQPTTINVKEINKKEKHFSWRLRRSCYSIDKKGITIEYKKGNRILSFSTIPLESK